MIKGVYPSYELMENLLIKHIGYYQGGMGDHWEWDMHRMKDLSTEQLKEVYTLCKDCFDRSYEKSIIEPKEPFDSNKPFKCDHNRRSRWTNGFQCNDVCKKWIGENDDEYLEELISNYYLGLRNTRIDMTKNNQNTKEIEVLEKECYSIYRNTERYTFPELRNYCNKYKDFLKSLKNEATI